MHKILKLENNEEARSLCGMNDSNIRLIEKDFKVKVALRGEHLKISGTANNIKKSSAFIDYLLKGYRSKDNRLEELGIKYIIDTYKKPKTSTPLNLKIAPKTSGQIDYVNAIKEFDIVFGIGPAGTGKTYLAMASAIDTLKKQEVRRIVLTRPAIEAGESLGFLPGDMRQKISPYLRPLYDALYDMMETERIEKYLDNGTIEVAPLAYMRGRTLNDAFVILDEAQNSTAEQMKMFLTRLGFNSKAVITGDITQSDLPGGKPVGLLQAQDILKKIKEIKFIYFSKEDVVRHPLVQRIIEAYDKTTKKN
jgi:phosphate starvation-inducible protein PhoH and related proteins